MLKESFSEALERFKERHKRIPHHGFSLMHQLDTFYNSLSYNDQDSLNSAAGGNFLYKIPIEGLQIIENKAKVRFPERLCDRQLEIEMTLDCLGDEINEIKKNESSVPTPVLIKCGGGKAGSVFEEILIDKEEFFLPKSPPIKPNKPTKTLPYPSRVEYEKKGENDKVQIQKFWEMFKKIHVNITLADALILMPKYQKMLKSLLSNKEKLNEMANTPVSENCSAIILKKLPEKLEDPGQFLIPCTFSELKCKALADLGASINLMPFSVYTKLGLPALQSTRMTLELANCSLCVPKGIARDVLVPVGRLTFPADFVVVDFECDYRVPLILGRPFLRTARTLIDVFGEEMSLRTDEERLIISVRSEELKYTTRPHKESVCMINIFSSPKEKDEDPNAIFTSSEVVKCDSLTTNGDPITPPSTIPTKEDLTNEKVEKHEVKTCNLSIRNEATNEFVKEYDESNHEVFKSVTKIDLEIHDNEEEEIAFLDGLLENENFFEMNDKKVESLERKTKEDFETKDEPKSKKELQVVHPDIEILNHFETTSYVGSDYVFYEDFNLVDMIFPMNIQGKIFDPGITFHEKPFEKDAFKDKSSKELAPSKSLLTLDVFDPLHPPLIDFHVTKALSGFTFSLLKLFSKKFFEPRIKNATVYLSYLVWGGFHLLEFLHPHFYPP
ncbi:reverse transcriptase domain-containing protein [Tanacetum coccineum]